MYLIKAKFMEGMYKSFGGESGWKMRRWKK